MPPSPSDALLTSLSHRSMATDFVVMLPQKEAHHCERVMEALESLDAIEAALTIYRESSEVSRINREAFERPVQVSQSTFGLLQRAIHWSEQTKGAFDITAGPLIEAWGFTKRSGRKPSAAEIEQARSCVGYQHLKLDADQRTVQFERPGMSINLGAIGKGDALDQLRSDLRQHEIENFLIHGGNSSIIAIGDQQPGSDCGWAVGISHPTKPTRRLGGVWLKDSALATSGSGKQFFHHQGRRYGHVIDPRSGQPAGDLLSLTVITDSAADADAAATGLYVGGLQAVAASFERDPDQRLLTVKAGRRQDEVEVGEFGLIDWVESAD